MEEKIEKVEEAPKAEEVKVEAPKAKEPKSEKPKKIRGRIRRAPIIVWSIIGSVVLVTASAVVGAVLFSATREATYAEQGHVFRLKNTKILTARKRVNGKSPTTIPYEDAVKVLERIRDDVGHDYPTYSNEEAQVTLKLVEEAKSLENILLGSTVKVGTTELFSSRVPLEIIDASGKTLFTVDFTNIGSRQGEVENGTLKYVGTDGATTNPYEHFRLYAAYDRSNDGSATLSFYGSISSSWFSADYAEYKSDETYHFSFDCDYIPVTEAK